MLYFDFGLTINKENMFALILFGVGAIAISFYCSVIEAALLSIVPSYVAQLEDKNPVLFKKISLLKGNLDEPLAAILSLNTIAHTVGAAGVGAKVAEIYGQAYIGLASGIMTFLILTLSEILPKSVGTKYWKQLIPFLAWSLHIIMFVMKPLIWVCTLITRWFDNKSNDISNKHLRFLVSRLWMRPNKIFTDIFTNPALMMLKIRMLLSNTDAQCGVFLRMLIWRLFYPPCWKTIIIWLW